MKLQARAYCRDYTAKLYKSYKFRTGYLNSSKTSCRTRPVRSFFIFRNSPFLLRSCFPILVCTLCSPQRPNLFPDFQRTCAHTSKRKTRDQHLWVKTGSKAPYFAESTSASRIHFAHSPFFPFPFPPLSKRAGTSVPPPSNTNQMPWYVFRI